MSLVDSDVEWRLPPLVSGIEVSATVSQQFNDLWFITEAGVMDSTIAVLVLVCVCVCVCV